MTDVIKELETQMAEIKAKLDKEMGKASAKVKVEELLGELGYTAEELYGETIALKANKKAKAAKKFNKTPPMYVHPDDRRKSWVGPDRPKPVWVTEFEAEGGDIESLKVK